MLISLSLAAVIASGIFCFAVYHILIPRQDSREPQYVNSTVPFVGHTLNTTIHGADYFRHLHKKVQRPVYTLPMLNGRMYMICSPEWVGAVFRNHKTISFSHIVCQALERIFCMDKPAMHIINENKNYEDGTRSGILNESHDMMAAALTPGPNLDEMIEVVVNEGAKRVNSLAPEGATHELRLWSWIRDNFSMASLLALYGPDNPYQTHANLLQDFWAFDKAMPSFMIVPFPSLLASKGYQARGRLFDAYAEYVEAGRYRNASKFIRRRVDINLNRFKIDPRNYAKGELSMTVGLLSNTIPSAFWLIVYIFSNPPLLSSIRAEVDACTSNTERKPNQGRLKPKQTISLTLLKTTCPLFISTFKEVLRLVSQINNVRYVIQDTLITNPLTSETFLLRKDSVVQIATNIIHTTPSIYGSDVDSFNPSRFLSSGLKSPDPAAPYRDETGKANPGAFRTFGSGNHLCLGRHFAQAEILAWAALLVAGFEIVDRGEEAGFTRPGLPEWKMPMGGVSQPTYDPEVDVRRRKGYEKVEWAFEV